MPSELGEAPPGHDASDVAAAKRVVEVLVERMPEAAARRMEAAGSLMLDFKDVSSVQYDTLSMYFRKIACDDVGLGRDRRECHFSSIFVKDR